MNHEENNLNAAPAAEGNVDAKMDAHSASQIDALARRLAAEDGYDTEADEAAGEESAAITAEPSGPTFEDLGLNPVLCKALADSGYTSPTGVQIRAIPAAMNGSDLRVASNTGSGKTAAFMLPALERIIAARRDNQGANKGRVAGPRVLILAPTRELALQVSQAASTYGRQVQGLRVATIVGGVPYGAQLKALRGPLDVLIATRRCRFVQPGSAGAGRS
jgi:superfamily II DNA/RNA helicase